MNRKHLWLILPALALTALYAIAAGMKISSSDSIICFGTNAIPTRTTNEFVFGSANYLYTFPGTTRFGSSPYAYISQEGMVNAYRLTADPLGTVTNGGAITVTGNLDQSYVLSNWRYIATDVAARAGCSPGIIFSVHDSISEGFNGGDIAFLTSGTNAADAAITWTIPLLLKYNGNAIVKSNLSSATLSVASGTAPNTGVAWFNGKVGFNTLDAERYLTVYTGGPDEGLKIRTTTTNRYAGLIYSPGNDYSVLEGYSGAGTGRGMLINVNTPASPKTAIFAEYTGNVGINNVGPTSTLHVAGSFAESIATGSAVTLGATNDIYLCNVDAQTVKLPNAATCQGRNYTVKLIAPATTGTVSTNGAGSDLIDGSGTYSLTASNKFIRVVSDAANWWIIGNN